MELPINKYKPEIMRLFHEARRLIVAAPTGSGKTTQIPAWLLSSAEGRRVIVVVPRRVLARTAARFVALNLGCRVGETVGYIVRFEDRTIEGQQLTFMTEGILLNLLQHDRTLAGVNTVVFDEAHERSLVGDVCQSLVKQLLVTTRPDLNVIVMSATLDVGKFARYWQAPIVEGEGRLYPVDVRYVPCPHSQEKPAWARGYAKKEEKKDPMQVRLEHAANQVAELIRQGELGAGTILVFMPGKPEIARFIHLLEELISFEVEILSLHAEQDVEEQDRCFVPPAGWRVVVATNVAETGVTVPKTPYVVDFGKEKISRFNPKTGATALVLESISKQSADQRAGRAGRECPGICIRLWSEQENASHPQSRDPEILRSDLSSVLLHLHYLGMDNHLDELTLLDSPKTERIHAAEQLLRNLEAVDTHGHITDLGKQMARLPLEPRLGCMVLEAARRNCLSEILTIASLDSAGKPLWVRPQDESLQAQAVRMRGMFRESNDVSDLQPLLRAYNRLAKTDALRNNTLHDVCYDFFLSSKTYHEASQIRSQLVDLVVSAGMQVNKEEAAFDDVVIACLLGYSDRLLGNGAGVVDTDLVLLSAARPAVFANDSVAPRLGYVLWLATQLREIETAKGNLLLATEVTALSIDLLQEAFPTRVRIKLSEFVFDITTQQVSCYELTHFDDRQIMHRRLLPAPSCAETTRVLEQAIADGYVTHTATAMSKARTMLARLVELERRSGEKLADISPECISTWLHERMDGMQAKTRLTQQTESITITWEDLGSLAKVPDLANQVERLRKAYPDKIKLNGCSVAVSYQSSGGERIIILELEEKWSKLLPSLKIKDLPKAWEGSKVYLEFAWSWFSGSIRIPATVESIDNFRCEAAVHKKFLELEKISVLEDVQNLVQQVEVVHPDRKEEIYLVAGNGKFFLEEKDAWCAADFWLRGSIVKIVRQTLRKATALEPDPNKVSELVATVLAGLGSDLIDRESLTVVLELMQEQVTSMVKTTVDLKKKLDGDLLALRKRFSGAQGSEDERGLVRKLMKEAEQLLSRGCLTNEVVEKLAEATVAVEAVCQIPAIERCLSSK